MRFHLYGGVTPDEADASYREHRKRMAKCYQHPDRDTVAVAMLRGPSGQVGHIKGCACCPECEAQLVDLLGGEVVDVESRPGLRAAPRGSAPRRTARKRLRSR